jgi:outer membrane protein OmpA-like peptidoglycan-associated protein
MKSITTLIIIACAGLLLSCASVAPPELVNARQSYEQAINSRAAQLVPAELHKAHVALQLAEKSFKDEPKSYITRDLSYIADRKAKMAEALATTIAEKKTTTQAEKDYQSSQTEIMKQTKEDLATEKAISQSAKDDLAAQTELTKSSDKDLATQTQLTESGKKDLATQTALTEKSKKDLASSEATVQSKNIQIEAEQRARMDAENRAAKAQADLVKLAAVKEEARGLVITLSGSVLFASGKSTLLPAAKTRLNQVTDALLATKERKLTVEGHTDSQGSSEFNQSLSQQRADAVRSYIVLRGYPGNLVQANGIGEERPVSDNANIEGRANNRRVEIIVNRAVK